MNKYQNLLNNLYIIDNKLSKLIKYYEELYLIINENISIEEETLNIDIISSIKNNQIEIKQEIEKNIIPLINTKI